MPLVINAEEQLNASAIELLTSLSYKVDELSKQLKHETHPVEKFGGVELASRVTGYKPKYIYKLVFLKQIPHIKRGTKLFFNVATLEKWIESGRVLTTDEQLKVASQSLSQSVKKSRNKATF